MRLIIMILSLIAAVAAAESTLPAGWSRCGGQGPGGVAEIVVDEPVPGGGPVVRLNAPEGSGTVAVRAVSIAISEPGVPLAAEMLVRAPRAGGMLTVHFYTDPRDGQHWYKTCLVPLTTSWVRQRLVANAPPGADWAGRKLHLHISLSTGEALIAGVTLAPAAAPAVAPVGSGRLNLLMNPGFDIGGGGWFLQAWPHQEATTALPVLTSESPDSGPSALQLPGGGVSVISTLVPFTPGRPYTLSLSLRLAPGAAKDGQAARFFLITPNWKIARKSVAVSDLGLTWKRFSLVFREGDQGSPHANVFYARVDPDTSIDLDSLQIEEGDTGTAYAPGAQVGLDPPGDGGFLSPGQAELTAVVGLPGGAPAPLRLALRGLAITGEVLYETQVELPACPEERRVVRMPVEHGREGVVACQLLVSGSAGAVLAESEARYAVFAANPPANPLLGMDDLPMRDGLLLLRRSEAVAKRLGLGFRRAFHDLPPGDGPDPHLAHARSLYAEQHRLAQRVMIVLNPANDSALHLGQMRKKGLAPSEAEIARDLPRFAAACAATARGLEGVVEEIEMLNEPNIWTDRGVSLMPPALYVRLLQAVRPLMQAAAPTVRLALNVNGVDTAYVGAIAELGGLKLVDLVTVHAYRATPEHAPIVADLARMRALIDRYAPGMPMVNSEQYYGLLAHGLAQGEYDRHYCGEDEVDITGRTLQTVLHGFTVGAPFGLLTHGSGLFMPTPFGQPWLYQGAGGLRALARLAQGVTGGRDVPVHDAVRVLLFDRADGSCLVSVNTRNFGERGTMGRPPGCTVFEVDGNPLTQDEVPVTYLPTYLVFPAGLQAEAVAQAMQAVAWRGFAFPVELSASRGADGRVWVTARNRERQPVTATVRWIGAKASPWQVTLPAAGSADLLLPTGDLRWQDDPDLAYEIASGEALDAGRLRLPVLLIPRLPTADPAAWEPSSWLELGEDRLATDFAPERPHTGPGDLAAQVALAWSPGGLHLLARITDDAVVPGPNTGGNAWSRDSLQLYVDQQARARSPRSLPDGGCTAWVLGRNDAGAGFAWLDLAPTGRYVGAANATTGLDPLPIVAWQRTATGWECRATFPPGALPALALQSGSVCGLSLLINDDDGQGRKRGLTLGPAGSEPIGRPWLWKRCQLGR